MSTIFGYTGQQGDIKTMGNALRHWQPDREDVFQNNEISLGVLELFKTPECPIIPQPYQYKNFIIIADCRIDNREDLAKEFSIMDLNAFADVHYIVVAFEKWGSEAPKHLIGDFAFVIYNCEDESVFAARDHFGTRTLYYSVFNGEFTFASEMKGILAYPGFQKRFNEEYVVSEFSALQIPEKDTFYQNIFLLEAGHCLSWKNKNLIVNRYWQLGDNTVNIPATVQDQEAEFNRLATESVRTRLRSYRKIGAEVSGGLDSTGIAAVAMEILGKGKEFYSYTYGKPSNDNEVKDDAHLVRELCAKYEIEKYLKVVNEKDLGVQELLDIMLKVHDDYESNGVPLFTSSFLKYAIVDDVGVVFSGWAGDQMVTNTCSGFTEPFAHEKRYSELWKDIRIRHSFSKAALRFVYYAIKCWNKKGFYNANVKRQRAIVEQGCLKDEIIDQYNLKNLPGLRYSLKSCTDIRTYHFRNLLHHGIQKRTFDHVLMGKHFRVDYRFPMLDLRLIEYINSLPFSTIAPKGKTRYLYKKFVKNLVPEELIRVHKSRVPTTPFASTFHEQNFDYLKEKFFAVANSQLYKYLDRSKLVLDKSLDEDKRSRKDFLKLYFLAKKME